MKPCWPTEMSPAYPSIRFHISARASRVKKSTSRRVQADARKNGNSAKKIEYQRHREPRIAQVGAAGDPDAMGLGVRLWLSLWPRSCRHRLR